MWFPINFTKVRGIPINAHPGAFGAIRRHDIHTGIDLYASERDWVFAIENGEVIANELFTGDETTPWWNKTNCLIIKSETRYFLYGEIESNLKVGDKVVSGEKIGEIIPVLPIDKIRTDIPEHSNCMLHLEMFDESYKLEDGYPFWSEFTNRPKYLLDPTPVLINILKKKYQQVNLLIL
jgi:murein DD-endopeptidase MepM/ murein hydrolase activator NlpD